MTMPPRGCFGIASSGRSKSGLWKTILVPALFFPEAGVSSFDCGCGSDCALSAFEARSGFAFRYCRSSIATCSSVSLNSGSGAGCSFCGFSGCGFSSGTLFSSGTPAEMCCVSFFVLLEERTLLTAGGTSERENEAPEVFLFIRFSFSRPFESS